MNNLEIEVETILEDIDDFVEEHQIHHDVISFQEIDVLLDKVTEYRSMLRRKYKELKQHPSGYDERFDEMVNNKMEQIKDYVTKGNEVRHKIRMSDFVNVQVTKENEVKHARFLIQDITRQLDEVYVATKVIMQDVKDDELVRRKGELTSITKKLNNVSSKIPALLASQSGYDVDAVVTRYDDTTVLLSNYETELNAEMQGREIEKETLFKESKLNIKLVSFKGYDSAVDIYTFQDNFDKLYSRTTPKRLMCDLLRNNHLEEPALSMVKAVESIDEMWLRLKNAYGDPRVMLNNKIMQLEKCESMWRMKDPGKIGDTLGKTTSMMKDLMKMCKKHNIEAKLYHGDAIDRIYKIMGESCVTRWISKSCDDDLDDEELWSKLVRFLEREMKVQQQKALVWKKVETKETKFQPKSNRRVHHSNNGRMMLDDEDSQVYNTSTSLICAICGEPGHVATSGPGGVKVIQYFTCKRFVEMTPQQRFNELRTKGLCVQCLLPNASSSDGKHKDGKCQRDFACKHYAHGRFPAKKHVLVCDEHKDTDANKMLLQQYKERCILRQKSAELPSYSKDIKLTFFASHKSTASKSIKREKDVCCDANDVIHNKGIYQLQTIKVRGQCYTIFYDSGCGDFVSRKTAVERIGRNAALECDGPIELGGVGGITTHTPHGIYTVKLPLSDGKIATMTGVCLNKITATFPTYPIAGKVEDDVRDAYTKAGGSINILPRLPTTVGGDVDFMIGIKYLRYHPKVVFQLPSGLTIYRSMFKNAGGGDGVIGGPHEVFSAIENYFNIRSNHQMTFFYNQLELYRNGFQINPDVSIIGYKTYDANIDTSADEKTNDSNPNIYTSRRIKLFTEAEETGTKITYRCVTCRSCKTCKEHDEVEEISIREEVEQHLINKSVIVDTKSRTSMARLPFTNVAKAKLIPNKHKAMKVYQQQVKKLHKNQKDRDKVIKSEAKLQMLGHVDYVHNLSDEQQLMLKENDVQNYIPWRAVWKSNSLSTPCRLVFDASQATDSGYSLNDTLAKGRNNMNKLQEVLIRWLSHKVAFHTDVQKMYNSVKLDERDWCYQRYIWNETLDPEKIPQQKVIKTLIYGVKSSGNQAEQGLRLTAKLSQDEYPEVAHIICKDVYVDDCLSGEQSEEMAKKRADEIEIVLNRGGFTLKGISFTGENPPDCLTDDGTSICVAGMKWYPKTDVLSLDIGELCFAKRVRGRKIISEESTRIPEKLTRRHCAAKVAEVFDLTGRVMPLISSLKLDLHDLVGRKLDWDDVIPDNLRAMWLSNFDMIQEMKTLRYKRAVIPEDAKSLEINTLDFGDASQQMACVAIYVRFQRRNGDFSCQLVLSRSKIVPDNTTQPRAELIASLLNAHTGEVVKRAFGNNHKDQLKLSDSQIILHWMRNEEKVLKQWVRNRVLEIKRFTNTHDWYYVDTSNMIADMGTRKGSTIKDVDQSSDWINGHPWMRKNKELMPIKRIEEINLNKDDVSAVKVEISCSVPETMVHVTEMLQKDEIIKRYEYSKYLINPNKFRFRMVVRIMAIVIKFINSLRNKVSIKHKRLKEKALFLTEDEIREGEMYFFKKGTNEMKHFNQPKSYNQFCQEKNDVLWYTGRILPEEKVTVAGKYTEAMKDLCDATFCVPVIDKHSPIAYSIVHDIHWHGIAKHSGVETVWRQVLKKVFIIEGRSIVKKFRKNCARCRYLNKKHIEVVMGPISKSNITIAPAFFITQVDLAGPFLAYSQHHKRTTVKIWLAVFCCSTTSTINIKLMEDYSSTSFILAFIRFACEVGYPKMLLPDEGSQLIKSCQGMKFNFTDVKNKLHRDAQVEFNVCPVGGHNMHGKVERKIKEVKLSIEKSHGKERLSIIEWETVCSEIANCINDMPLALGNIVSDYESMDLITPNRLRLGRNNDRSPEGVMMVSSDPKRIFKSNTNIFNSWFEIWLMCHLPKLVYQPKWFKTTNDLKEGDVVLFVKQESSLQAKYQYGMVKSVETDKDGKIRKVIVKYRNHNENLDRETYRAVRDLVMIHGIDELDIVEEIGEIASNVDLKLKLLNKEH